ncbi:hypothetical protein AWZ03_000659 [Drosophila navojoa]|uniref:Uncharacterized protein n=1 Tax=Drosophila navojoa TaxID=7232 RepID=A0A484BWC0_DRONA|nr:hypothetical protein AWZ03_000659 [Drosophila navojoa]
MPETTNVVDVAQRENRLGGILWSSEKLLKSSVGRHGNARLQGRGVSKPSSSVVHVDGTPNPNRLASAPNSLQFANGPKHKHQQKQKQLQQQKHHKQQQRQQQQQQQLGANAGTGAIYRLLANDSSHFVYACLACKHAAHIAPSRSFQSPAQCDCVALATPTL